MDVQMPKVDGFEATRQIRKMEEISGIRIPIIAMTAHAMKGDKEKCLESGMDYYITKPVDSKELIELIQKIIKFRLISAGWILTEMHNIVMLNLYE